eukprot:UN03481
MYSERLFFLGTEALPKYCVVNKRFDSLIKTRQMWERVLTKRKKPNDDSDFLLTLNPEMLRKENIKDMKSLYGFCSNIRNAFFMENLIPTSNCCFFQTSVDDPNQSMDNVVATARNHLFWSSTGNVTEDDNFPQSLLFKLENISIITKVSVKAYCAKYQAGRGWPYYGGAEYDIET